MWKGSWEEFLKLDCLRWNEVVGGERERERKAKK